MRRNKAKVGEMRRFGKIASSTFVPSVRKRTTFLVDVKGKFNDVALIQ
jgi:hypothetical protein